MVQFASYLGRVLHKTHLIFSGINGPNIQIVGQICAKFRPNCSFSVKSMKFGTEIVFKMTKKIGYGGKPENPVLSS